jgi:hypothetical protein
MDAGTSTNSWIQQGADANHPESGTLETPSRAALCTPDGIAHNLVLRVLPSAGADPNLATRPNVETGALMCDCRTKAETPLHRAAAFDEEEAIERLLKAGAKLDVKDMHGDTPAVLGQLVRWPTPILLLLCYGEFRVNPRRKSLRAYVLGESLA